MDHLQLTRHLFAEIELDLDARDRARSRLEQRMREPPRRRIWRRAGLVAAAIAALMALQVALPPGGTGPATSAAAELHRLATVAARRQPEQGGPVAYSRYEEYVVVGGQDLTDGTMFVAFIRQSVEAWHHPNGSARRTTAVDGIDYPSERDRIAWERVGGPAGLSPGESVTQEFSSGTAGVEDLDSLPRNPAALLERIRADLSDNGLEGDRQILVRIGTLLGRGDADPALRSALFEAAALLTGIELLGEVTDPLGRVGEGIVLEAESERMLLIVDPASSLPLAYESTTTEGPAQGIASWRAYRDQARVQDIGAAPQGQ